MEPRDGFRVNDGGLERGGASSPDDRARIGSDSRRIEVRPTTRAKSRLTRTRLGLTLLLSLVAPGFVAADDPPPVKVIYHNKRSLRIPFNIVPSERPRIKEILLVISSDQG